MTGITCTRGVWKQVSGPSTARWASFNAREVCVRACMRACVHACVFAGGEGGRPTREIDQKLPAHLGRVGAAEPVDGLVWVAYDVQLGLHGGLQP